MLAEIPTSLVIIQTPAVEMAKVGGAGFNKVAIKTEIRVKTLNKPSQVTLWTASNPVARDFRLMSIGNAWRGDTLRNLGGGRYVGRIPKPPRGWSAGFIELSYGSPTLPQLNQVYTTDVFMTPDTLPFSGVPCMTE